MHLAYRSHLAIVLFACWCVSGSTAATAEPHTLAAEGFQLAYNLDHEAAIAKLTKAVQAYPDNPVGHRSLAATVWLQLLLLKKSYFHYF